MKKLFGGAARGKPPSEPEIETITVEAKESPTVTTQVPTATVVSTKKKRTPKKKTGERAGTLDLLAAQITAVTGELYTTAFIKDMTAGELISFVEKRGIEISTSIPKLT